MRKRAQQGQRLRSKGVQNRRFWRAFGDFPSDGKVTRGLGRSAQMVGRKNQRLRRNSPGSEGRNASRKIPRPWRWAKSFLEANLLNQVVNQILHRDALLRHRVAVADGDAAVFLRLKVVGDAERGTDLVLTAVALADQPASS